MFPTTTMGHSAMLKHYNRVFKILINSKNQNRANSNLNNGVFCCCSGLSMGMVEFAAELSKAQGSVSTMSLRPCS